MLGQGLDPSVRHVFLLFYSPFHSVLDFILLCDISPLRRRLLVAEYLDVFVPGFRGMRWDPGTAGTQPTRAPAFDGIWNLV